MTGLEIALIILVGLLYLKWILIVLIYPFQAFYCRYRKYGGGFRKVLASPFWLLDKITRGGWQRFSLYQISMIPSNHLRKWLYQGLGAECGKYSVFHFRTEIRSPYKLKIGKGSIVGDNALLDAHNYLTIGENVNMSSNVVIYTGHHDYRDPDFHSVRRPVSVTIGDRAWLGSNVMIMPGVTVGEGAVCCSGCVVTKDVEPYTVVAGIPAKKINDRPTDLRYEFKGKVPRLY